MITFINLTPINVEVTDVNGGSRIISPSGEEAIVVEVEPYTFKVKGLPSTELSTVHIVCSVVLSHVRMNGDRRRDIVCISCDCEPTQANGFTVTVRPYIKF